MATTTASSSAATTSAAVAAAAKFMEKDDQLQLCIQRFVSDTQSMINQFSELFINELRRFADVCMDFSVSYRNIQEDRQFLSVENKSLKDELDARTAEVDFLGKELREIREENDELIRKIECLNINSDGEISMMIPHNDRPRHYAVVNSMPTFPRRYSSAIGYEPPASSTGSYTHHHSHPRPDDTIDENQEFTTSIADTTSSLRDSSSINFKNQLTLLLTPPIAFNNNNNNININNNNSSKHVSKHEDTRFIANTSQRRSHSRDDISKYYTQLVNNNNNNNNNSDCDSISNQLICINNNNNTSGSSRNSDRSPSMNEIRSNDKMHIQMVYNQNNGLQEQRTLSTAVSSSAGTFYDCSNQIKQLFGQQQQQKADKAENDHNNENNNDNDYENDNHNRQESTDRPQILICHRTNNDDDVDDDDDNNNKRSTSPNGGQCAIVDVEYKKHLQPEFNEDSMYGNTFIAKTPSPNYCDYNQHLEKYYCDNGDKKRTNSVAAAVTASDEFLLNAPAVQRYNSKKLSKKRKSRRRAGIELNRDDNNDQHQPEPIITGIMMPIKSFDSYPIIPSPIIDLNRYLLVEICHIVSPSHFYLIINDEKIGTNVFEDFLERFQNFYKSIELFGHDAQFSNNSFDDDEEHQLRLLVSVPPATQSLTIGSFWACYIDEELDWRRVQILDRATLDENHDPNNYNNHDEYVLVKDVDSGYSSLVHIQMIRPLIPEMAHVPAFAIRSSLAFIYPHHISHGLYAYGQQQRRHDDQYYDQWPMECCQFFEDITYDQILTASVLQINHSIYNTNESFESNLNSNDEIAHVLLWCTSSDDVEILINRKLIELDYATNVADNDLWMEQFNEVFGDSPRPDEAPNIETCFNIQLAKQNDSPNAEADVSTSTFQNTNDTNESRKTTPIESNVNADYDSNINNKQQADRKIKIKTRSKKKKDSLNEVKDVNNECPEDSCHNQQAVPIQMIGEKDNDSSSNLMNDHQQQQTTSNSVTPDPAVAATDSTINDNNNQENKMSISSSSDNRNSKKQQQQSQSHLLLPKPPSACPSSSQSSPRSSPTPSQSPNSLLQLPIEPFIHISIDYNNNNNNYLINNNNNINDNDDNQQQQQQHKRSVKFNDYLEQLKIHYEKMNDNDNNNDNNSDDTNRQNSTSIFDYYCYTLHHDPRLSNWIVQKHSRHVTLKKALTADKITYLMVISCYFEPNKFIGILPFGERKIDTDNLVQFLRNVNDCKTPFSQFIMDMTEFYCKEQSQSSLKLLPEQCIFEQNNTSSTIVFYDQSTGLYLRGHIVGRDMMMIETTRFDEIYDQQQSKSSESVIQSKSYKDLLKSPSFIHKDDNDPIEKKKKSLSLRRRSSIHDSTTKYIIYAIDVGRYFQIPLKHIYHLEERFKITKPFAIVCKLHGYPNNQSKLSKIHSMIMENRYFGIRFIDIDFSTERFAVELFTLKLNEESNNRKMDRSSSSSSSSTTWRTSSPLITKNLIHLL